MELSQVNRLWQIIIDYGKNIRLKAKDGLNSWNIIKTHLETISIDINWKDTILNNYDDMIKMGVCEMDDHNISYIKRELDHFILQHGRIPYRNKLSGSLVRLFQIAYNCGQFKGAIEGGYNYPIKWFEYYIDNKLDTPQSYCDDINLLLINKQITNELIEIILLL